MNAPIPKNLALGTGATFGSAASAVGTGRHSRRIRYATTRRDCARGTVLHAVGARRHGSAGTCGSGPRHAAAARARVGGTRTRKGRSFAAHRRRRRAARLRTGACAIATRRTATTCGTSWRDAGTGLAGAGQAGAARRGPLGTGIGTGLLAAADCQKTCQCNACYDPCKMKRVVHEQPRAG